MAIRITRVYTRRGDQGETDLVGGARVAKDSPRIEAYGTVDELNAAVGVVRAVNAALHARSRAGRELDAILRKLQNELFDLGGELATPPSEFRPGMFRVGAAEVKALETCMDGCQKDLQPLKSFVLPGGGRVSAARGAGRASPHAERGHRRVAARLPEPPLRPALRALALDRSPPGRARVPLGATPPARGGAARAAQALRCQARLTLVRPVLCTGDRP